MEKVRLMEGNVHEIFTPGFGKTKMQHVLWCGVVLVAVSVICRTAIRFAGAIPGLDWYPPEVLYYVGGFLILVGIGGLLGAEFRKK